MLPSPTLLHSPCHPQTSLLPPPRAFPMCQLLHRSLTESSQASSHQQQSVCRPYRLASIHSPGKCLDAAELHDPCRSPVMYHAPRPALRLIPSPRVPTTTAHSNTDTTNDLPQPHCDTLLPTPMLCLTIRQPPSPAASPQAPCCSTPPATSHSPRPSKSMSRPPPPARTHSCTVPPVACQRIPQRAGPQQPKHPPTAARRAPPARRWSARW